MSPEGRYPPPATENRRAACFGRRAPGIRVGLRAVTTPASPALRGRPPCQALSSPRWPMLPTSPRARLLMGEGGPVTVSPHRTRGGETLELERAQGSRRRAWHLLDAVSHRGKAEAQRHEATPEPHAARGRGPPDEAGGASRLHSDGSARTVTLRERTAHPVPAVRVPACAPSEGTVLGKRGH